MSRSTKALAVSAVLATLAAGSFGSVALAVSPDGGSGQPLLGFIGRMHFGYGMEVQRVHCGSLAQRMGLESGDVIVRINGRPIRTMNDYYSSLRWSGGQVEVVVNDCWGRGYMTVYAILDNGVGPSGVRCEAKKAKN